MLRPEVCLENATRLLDEAELTSDLVARDTLTTLACAWIDTATTTIAVLTA